MDFLDLVELALKATTNIDAYLLFENDLWPKKVAAFVFMGMQLCAEFS